MKYIFILLIFSLICAFQAATVEPDEPVKVSSSFAGLRPKPGVQPVKRNCAKKQVWNGRKCVRADEEDEE